MLLRNTGYAITYLLGIKFGLLANQESFQAVLKKLTRTARAASAMGRCLTLVFVMLQRYLELKVQVRFEENLGNLYHLN